MVESSPLSPAQLRALLDILNHYETYAEAQSFRGPEAIENYGFPFSSDATVKSASPLLQLMLTKLVLPFPSFALLPDDFWSIKFLGVLKSFADVELSETYDRGYIGARKIVTTGASSVHELLTRGLLAGVPRMEAQALPESNPHTAKGLAAAWEWLRQGMVYGDLADQIADHTATSPDLEAFSPAMQDFVSYVIIHIATLVHRVFVLSTQGQDLLKILEGAHKMIPYAVVAQTLRIGNPATMINGMMKIFLAKASVASFTNMIGLTKDASEGMNLLGRIISIVLSWDASDLKKVAKRIKSREDKDGAALLAIIDAHLESSSEEQEAVRQRSIDQRVSIVMAILYTRSPDDAGTISDAQHARFMEYYAAKLGYLDRQKIIQVICSSQPDHVTSLIRDTLAASDRLIRWLHAGVDLKKYVGYLEKFITDFIKTSKPKLDDSKEPMPPSIEDYVQLFRRHRMFLFEYIHDISSNCPELKAEVIAWVKRSAAAFRQAPSEVNLQAGRVSSTNSGAGSLDSSLQSIFSELPSNSQQQVRTVLSAYGEYLNTLENANLSRMQHIIDGSKYEGETPLSGGSMTGAGVYIAKWESLLNETLVSPEGPSGFLRYGRDIIHVPEPRVVTTLGDFQPQKPQHPLPREPNSAPDITAVVQALAPRFRELVAEISSRGLQRERDW
ncbi:hypothetical protein BX600DRAFT_518402 [Xylariales sp. PMI_506]|nr:hypothetical protein BX600DRAFT_518402 [Xylariales sp. PMI_506]